jgi:hypothetical protein
MTHRAKVDALEIVALLRASAPNRPPWVATQTWPTAHRSWSASTEVLASALTRGRTAPDRR